MNTKFDISQVTKDDWRELGFYYEINDEKNKWNFRGSKKGLESFAKILFEFSENKNNEKMFEHDHYGPYSYLKIQCYSEPLISKNSIMGPLLDLKKLGEIIKKNILLSKLGETIIVDKEFSSQNEYTIEIVIEEDNFDPSQADPLLINENRS